MTNSTGNEFWDRVSKRAGMSKIRFVLLLVFFAVFTISIFLGVSQLSQFPRVNQTTSTWSMILFFSSMIGMMFVLPKKASSRSRSEVLREEIAEAQTKVENAPKKTGPVWDLARKILEQYFNENLKQSQAIFKLSVAVMIAGFLVILGGIVLAYVSPTSITVTIIASVAGLLTEFIGATFLFMYRSAISQGIVYWKTMERINVVGMAMTILDNIPKESLPESTKIKADLIQQFIRQYSPSNSEEDSSFEERQKV